MTGRHAKIKDRHFAQDVRAVAGHHAMPAALLLTFTVFKVGSDDIPHDIYYMFIQ